MNVEMSQKTALRRGVHASQCFHVFRHRRRGSTPGGAAPGMRQQAGTSVGPLLQSTLGPAAGLKLPETAPELPKPIEPGRDDDVENASALDPACPSQPS